jgi:glycosyltransferase involved in cell wall biosynthesis
MNSPLVSAIITTYNYGRFVVQAVESVLAQTYPNVEVIVVDDGSTDDTALRLEPYLKKIRYIHQENAGVDAARNNGIRAAAGTFIGLLDADDMWHPRRVERQLQYIAEHPDIAVIGADTIIDMSNGWPALPDKTVARTVSIEQLVIMSRFAPSSALIRKDCFDAVGFFRSKISGAADRDMWIRLAAKYQIIMLQMPLMFYRNHGQNMSTAAAHMDEVDRRMLRAVFSEIPELRKRPLLRRKAFSYAASMASFLYTAAGSQRQALGLIVESLLLWPFAYEPNHPKTPAARVKMFMVILLRALRLKRPHAYSLAAKRKIYG